MSIDRRTCLAGFSALALGGDTHRVAAQLRPLIVMAAISLKGALDKLAMMWRANAENAPLGIAYGASNALARQIELGAPGDCFLSADLDWMTYLVARGLVRADTQREFAANSLVIIAQAGQGVPLDPAHPGSLKAALAGESPSGERLAVARTDLVPAGRYAREALQNLGQWEDVKRSLAETENVHSALQLVVRGEARLGIVYRSDARGDARVRVASEVPTSSHKPIRYPAAMLAASSHPQAMRFLEWLGGDTARAVLNDAGLGLPEAAR